MLLDLYNLVGSEDARYPFGIELMLLLQTAPSHRETLCAIVFSAFDVQ